MSELLARTNASSLLVDDALCIHICPCVRRSQRAIITRMRNRHHPPTFDFSPPAHATFFEHRDESTCQPQQMQNLSRIQATVANVTAMHLSKALSRKAASKGSMRGSSGDPYRASSAVHTVVLGDLFGLTVFDDQQEEKIAMAQVQVGVPTGCSNLFRPAPVIAGFISGLQEVAFKGMPYLSVHLRR